MNQERLMQEYHSWLHSDLLTEKEKNEVLELGQDSETLALAFGDKLSFGTAGLRSVMGMGIGRINRFTVAQTTQGIAHLVKKAGGAERGVAIACDSRNQSLSFAETAASVLAANEIKVFIFDDIRPTPELSFAIRHYGCMAGINITASHNPKEYNGYKAYWEDGAQISPEQAKIVSDAVDKIDVLGGALMADFQESVKNGVITVLGKETDEAYLQTVLKTQIDADVIHAAADDLRIVYSPLHGTGYRLVPEILKRAGLKHLYTVESQMCPDGNFPTVEKPNPEYKNVFAEGIDIARRIESDLVIATDPDADRIGVVCRAKDGDFVTISGNQMGALMLDYVIGARRRKNMLSQDAFAVKSIVSTDMAYAIAEKNGIRLHDVLTGFKFIGEVIKKYEAEGKEKDFLFGFEESYGYLFGSYARDKDAVGAALMIVEMTAYYRSRGMTLIDALEDLFERYGIYREYMQDIYLEGLDGIEKRRRLMSGMREKPPVSFGGKKVAKIGDYSTGIVRTISDGNIEKTDMPVSDVLYYTLENQDKIIVRPSGTEPKVKVYFLAHGDTKETLEEKLKQYISDVNNIVDGFIA